MLSLQQCLKNAEKVNTGTKNVQMKWEIVVSVFKPAQSVEPQKILIFNYLLCMRISIEERSRSLKGCTRPRCGVGGGGAAEGISRKVIHSGGVQARLATILSKGSTRKDGLNILLSYPIFLGKYEKICMKKSSESRERGTPERRRETSWGRVGGRGGGLKKTRSGVFLIYRRLFKTSYTYSLPFLSASPQRNWANVCIKTIIFAGWLFFL